MHTLKHKSPSRSHQQSDEAYKPVYKLASPRLSNSVRMPGVLAPLRTLRTGLAHHAATAPLRCIASSKADKEHPSWKLLRTGIKIALGLGCALAAAPSIVSLPPVTRAACSLASSVLPGQVQVQSLDLHWHRPISLRGLQVAEGKQPGSRQLLQVQRVRSSEPLWQVALGRPCRLVVQQPVVDATYDDTCDDFRLIKFMEAAGLLEPDLPRQPLGSDAAAAASAASVWDASESGGAAGAEAVAVAVACSRPASRQQADKVVGDSTAVSPASSAGSSSSSSSSSLKSRLMHADATIGFTADLHLHTASLYLADGQLLVCQELREMVGQRMHATAALGRSALEGVAEELQLDTSWAAGFQAQQQHVEQQEQQQQQHVEQQQQQQQQQQGGKRQRKRLWPRQRASPGVLQVHADNMWCEARGWQVGGQFLLFGPIQSELELTPAFARYGLAQANPLLGQALLLQQAGRVQLSLEPRNQLLPYRQAQLRVQPLRLALSRSPLLQELLGWLRLGSGGAGRASHLAGQQQQQQQQQQQAGGGGSSPGSDASGVLRMWTSEMAWHVDKDDELVRTERVDMLLGAGRRDLHLVMWGGHRQQGGQVDMCIGIPSGTLQQLLGVQGLPAGYVLPIRVSGSVERPVVDWAEASKKLATLSALQAYRHAAARPEQAGGRAEALQGTAAVQEAPGAGAGTSGSSWWERALGYLGSSTLSFLEAAELRFQNELQQVPQLKAPLPWEQVGQGGGRASAGASGGEPAGGAGAAR